MTVLAHCSDCDSTHTVGSRSFNGLTTECPTCGSTRYGSECESESVDADEIYEILINVDGMGEGTIANVEDTIGSLTLVPTLRMERLTDIEGIGATVAKRIVKKF